MYFIVDENKKIAYGWSAKSGCTHIKKLVHFLIYNDVNYPIHSGTDFKQLPYNEMENYTIIIFVRNPYKRLVSGFLNKYRLHGGFRDLWKDDKNITFRTGRCPARSMVPFSLEIIKRIKERGINLVNEIISHRVPLSNAPDAYKRFSNREDGYRKIVFIIT